METWALKDGCSLTPWLSHNPCHFRSMPCNNMLSFLVTINDVEDGSVAPRWPKSQWSGNLNPCGTSNALLRIFEDNNTLCSCFTKFPDLDGICLRSCFCRYCFSFNYGISTFRPIYHSITKGPWKMQVQDLKWFWSVNTVFLDVWYFGGSGSRNSSRLLAWKEVSDNAG